MAVWFGVAAGATYSVVTAAATWFLLRSSTPARPTPMPDVEMSPADQLRREARAQLGIDTVSSYNFIFAGNSGSGKSSLINALLGVEDGSIGAAAVGDAGQCTQVITGYIHPRYNHIVLWDAPGGGVPGHSAHKYFMEKKLYAFDVIIITTDTRFSELDKAIACSAKEYKVPVVFVRTKSDQGIANRSRRDKIPKRAAKCDLQKDVVEDIRSSLPEDLQDREIFVLSSCVMACHDEFRADDYLLDEEKFMDYIQQVARDRRNCGMGGLLSVSLVGCAATAGTVRQLTASPPAHPAPIPEPQRKAAWDHLGIDTKSSYNFVFTGNPGTGNRSLINAFMGVEGGSPGAANIGHGVEGTKKITKYIHPQYNHIALWDTPGGGVPGHPAASYFMDQMLFAFDAIIITTADRFTELDLAIARSAKINKIPMVLVRTKSDEAIKGKSRQRREIPKSSLKYDLQREAEEYIRSRLPEDLRKERIFVLSSRVLNYPDEFPIQDYLLDEDDFIRYTLGMVLNRRNGGKGNNFPQGIFKKL